MLRSCLNRIALGLLMLATGVAVSRLPAQGLTSAFSFTAGGPELWLANDEARPGQTIMAGVYLKLPKGWHTYWRDPGDSGTAPQIQWTLPAGVTADPIQWPVPEKDLATAGDIKLYTYVYREECLLLVPLHLAPGLSNGPLELTAKVSWQQCAENCVPKHGDAKAVLTVAGADKPSAHAADLLAWQARLPKPRLAVPFKAAWASAATESNRLFQIELTGAPKSVDFFPFHEKGFSVQGATKLESPGDNVVRLAKAVEKDDAAWPKTVSGLVVFNPGTAEAAGFAADLELGAGDAEVSSAAPGGAPASTEKLSIGSTLLFAFIGGLILNIMPCVLPVIALKVLGFVSKSKESPARVRQLGLIYGLGVITSFIVLAGLAVSIQKAGGLAGWGSAFQNVQFRTVLVVLVTMVALNLFGLFEVSLGGSTLTAASGLTRKEGAGGAFFNGVLATVLATPCTAPFLSVALAFAFTQPPFVIILTFIAIGVGLALPFVILCWHPAFLKFMPKPGDWMVHFKVMMGFPMLATAVWLFWATAPRFGKSGVLWFGLFLVALAFSAYIWGEFVQKGSKRIGLAIVLSLGLTGAVYAVAMEDGLDWRHPNRVNQTAIKWEMWSEEAVAKARQEGHPVLVDFTADTCLTCQLNKRSSLDIAATRAKLKEINAVAFIGDYTDENPSIGEMLKRYDRPGVPLVLIYPKDPTKKPAALPTLLTPGIVAQALDDATK